MRPAEKPRTEAVHLSPTAGPAPSVPSSGPDVAKSGPTPSRGPELPRRPPGPQP
nr:MAG TPA: hypothetical protein [Caudoviricetes sp.]